MGRKGDLERNIQQSYELVRDYENIRDLSADPRERARAHQVIEEQWQLIKDYLDEYLPLCQRLNVDISGNLLDIVLHFPEYEVFTSPEASLGRPQSASTKTNTILNTEIDTSSSYQNVEIRIAKTADPNSYSVELRLSDSLDFPRRNMTLNTAKLLSYSAAARNYGLHLGQALFADTALGGDFGKTLSILQQEGKQMRVRLRLDDLGLHHIHWERLRFPLGKNWQPLAIMAETPFSRYILTDEWQRLRPIKQRPLRTLVIISSPINLDEYDLSAIDQEERQIVHEMLGSLPHISPKYLETGTATPPTLENIRRELVAGYHLVHFLCHGTVKTKNTFLYLEDEFGKVAPIASDEVVDSFRTAGTPPLFCFLAACETAANSGFNAFVPLGPYLVAEGGVAAALAMRDKVSLATARKFTKQFYARLLAHGYVDLAVNEARALVRDSWDWSVPVLFSRLRDNRLVELSGFSPEEASATTERKQTQIAQMNLGEIRQIINQRFDDAELEAFCMDNFLQAYDKFSRGMRKDEKISILLDYCRRRPKDYQKLLELFLNKKS